MSVGFSRAPVRCFGHQVVNLCASELGPEPLPGSRSLFESLQWQGPKGNVELELGQVCASGMAGNLRFAESWVSKGHEHLGRLQLRGLSATVVFEPILAPIAS